ncbi:MAG: Mrp/NBP35 family ATP-binding protein [Anaerolineales bacterium]|nr:Mrp/NBP35 family ATP-binding protein [Anaerolineales bacterium]
MLGNKHALTNEQVLRALATVQEPELHRDLVSLDMIKNLQIEGGRVSFTIMLTTPACPLRHVMERDVRAALAQVPGVTEVKVGWDARVTTAGSGASRGALPMPARNVVAIASGKGGVGKSTVAVNVAVALAQTGARVGLLDADIYGPNTPMMLGASYTPVQSAGKLLPARAHGIELFSMGFMVRSDQPIIWRGPMLDKAIRQFLTDVAWGDLDYLIVDMPPGTGDAQLVVSQAMAVAGAVIVTLPQAVSQADARRGLEGFKQMDVPVLGVVENMSYLALPDGSRLDVFGQGGGRALAEAAGVPFIGEIPMDPQVRIGGDAGTPVVISHPDSPAAQAFVAVARDVAAKISVANFLNQNNVIPITEIN